MCGLHFIFKICCLKIVKKFLFDKEENMRFIIFKLFAKYRLYAKKVVKIALNRGFNNYFENFVKFRFHILIAYFT